MDIDDRRIRYRDLFLYLYHKTNVKISRLKTRNLTGKCIVGAYDGQNLGDMALRMASKAIFDNGAYGTYDIKSCSYSNSVENLIYGGGATFTLAEAKRLSDSSVNPSKVSLVGVDVQGAKSKYTPQIIDYLRNVKFISVRQKWQRAMLESTLKREVVQHPDISFALNNKFTSKSRSRSNVLCVNIVPFMVMRKGLTWDFEYPWANFSSASDASLKEKAKSLNSRYVYLVRNLVKDAIKKGLRVVHHPFELADYLYAPQVLGDLEVELLPYVKSVNKNISRFSNYEAIIATRYHAHIFAIMQDIPVVSLAYAMKCESLFDDLGMVGHEDRQVRIKNESESLPEDMALDNLMIYPEGIGGVAGGKLHEALKSVVI